MNWLKYIAAALIVGAAACGQADGSSSQLTLAGTWKFKPASLSSVDPPADCSDESAWKDIRVPANWHSAGFELSGSVWYCRHLSVPVTRRGQRIQLVFEGIDYAADVWLNGTLLGCHEGYFEPFQFDVSERLSFSDENLLLVLVHSPNEPVGPVWSLRKRLIKGVYGQHDTRPGGAWSVRGQEQNTGGIWAPVYLSFSSKVSIQGMRAVPHPAEKTTGLAEGATWKVQIELDILNPGKQVMNVELGLNLTPENFVTEKPTGGEETIPLELRPGANHLRLTLPCKNTYLWWSWDRGAPNMYRLQALVTSGGRTLDRIESVLGFRTVEVTSPGKEWWLNGKRIFLRGTNYISSQWLSEMDREKYRFDVALMKRANINAVRVHAHIEAPDFYLACDESGVLVWQDFALQWGYSEDPEFEREAVRQAVAMARVLGNHASIIGWTMHNEPPWDAAWMQYKYKDYDSAQDKQLDERLYRAVSEFDPTRYTHKYSADREHPWLGWYSGTWLDYNKPTRESFITEFGAQALPDVAVLRKIFGDENLWPDTDEKWNLWDYHNFQKHETFDLARVPMGESPEEFVRNTQEYQARLVKFAAESYRRQRYAPVTALFQFMFSEDWPSVNWGIVDYWRNPKPGYAALATAYQPVLPSIDWPKNVWNQNETVTMDVWIINDLEKEFPDSHLNATLLGVDRRPASQVVFVNIEPDSGKKVLSLTWKNLPPGRYEVSVRIADRNGELLGLNNALFQVVPVQGVAQK